jgi:hypothetical protein
MKIILNNGEPFERYHAITIQVGNSKFVISEGIAEGLKIRKVDQDGGDDRMSITPIAPSEINIE